MGRIVGLGLLLLSLCACGGSVGSVGGSGGVIIVSVHTVLDGDGQGNTAWDISYIESVFARIDIPGVVFRPVVGREVRSEEAWSMDQLPLYYTYRDELALPGMVTVLISHPLTQDSAGITRQGWQDAPFLVMRARDLADLDEVARIFLHELGHCFGMAHYPLEPGGPQADDWHTRTDGVRLFLAYANAVGL